jgi:hypothetical protein
MGTSLFLLAHEEALCIVYVHTQGHPKRHPKRHPETRQYLLTYIPNIISGQIYGIVLHGHG